MKSLAIVLGSIALVVYPFARAQADEVSSEIPKSQLASMGLAGLRPMSDAAGNQVRGNCAIFGGSGYIGIPLDSVGGARLVVRLNWSYQAGFPDLTAVILRHLLDVRQYPEPIPSGRLDF
jgi:hypothetical protein